MPAPTAHPEYDDPLPGWGAFKHADTEDAKRRRPASSLEDYARARGLDYRGSEHVPGWAGVLPGDGRLQFNVCRDAATATLLFHEVFPVEEEQSEGRGPRGVVNYVYAPKLGKRGALSFVPVLGALFTDADKRPEAVGVPATVAAAQVPQAAVVPEFEVTGKGPGTFGASDGLELGPYGLEGYTLRGTGLPNLTADFAQRLMATPFADALKQLAGRPYLHVAHEHARLAIRVDGFAEPQELDALHEAVASAKQGLAAAASADHAPQPFAQPLPPAQWPQWGSGPDSPGETFDEIWAAWHRPQPPWLGPLREQLGAHGGVAEDALAFHRAFPRLPVPGKAFAVIGGGGGANGGRLAFFAERQILAFNVGSNAWLLRAAPGAPEAAPADSDGVSYAVRDGVFCVWAPRVDAIPGEVDALVAKAVELGRATGLASL